MQFRIVTLSKPNKKIKINIIVLSKATIFPRCTTLAYYGIIPLFLNIVNLRCRMESLPSVQNGESAFTSQGPDIIMSPFSAFTFIFVLVIIPICVNCACILQQDARVVLRQPQLPLCPLLYILRIEAHLLF